MPFQVHETPQFSLAVRRLRKVKFPLSEDALPARSINRCGVFVELDLLASRMGWLLIKKCCDIAKYEAIRREYHDVFSAKSKALRTIEELCY